MSLLLRRAGWRIFLTALILETGERSLAANQCSHAFESQTTRADYPSLTVSSQRTELIKELKTKNVPSFLKETSAGPLPVILMNHASNLLLKDFMSQTVGAGTLLQPGSGYTDHGLLRIGGVQLHGAGPQAEAESLQVDWAPMNRNWWDGDTGEIHGTGLMWRSLEWRMKDAADKNKYSRVSLEVVIAMKSRDRRWIETNQRMRRAGLISLIGSFPDYKMSRPSPVALPVDENCFQHASGSTLVATRLQLIASLKELGLKQPVSLLENTRIQKFISSARKLIDSADALSPNGLNPNMLMDNLKLRYQLRQALPRDLGKLPLVKLEKLANSLFALKTTTEAERIFNAYGFRPNMTARENIENPKVVAILAYDSPERASSFFDATYTAKGAFGDTGWGDNDGAAPYLDQRPLP